MEKVIIYGAGKAGRKTYEFLKKKGIENYVYCFVDKRAANLLAIDSKNIISFEDSLKLDLPYVVVGTNADVSNEIEQILKNTGRKYYMGMYYFAQILNQDMTELTHEYIAFYHDVAMENYYDSAEDELSKFWGSDTFFYQLFQYLDLNNVIELACGHGRHVTKYYDKAGTITLVDILDKNIHYCQERFADKQNICFYQNNGSDLAGLEDQSYTSLFTYDAMVHFELLDIASYLKETYRVLKPGSYALFHHSNNTADYKVSFATGKSGRNYMSADIFAHLAYRSGFEIVESRTLDWDGEKDLDCITLLRKAI